MAALAETRSIDWVMLVIEAAALSLILYEVIVGELRHRRDHQRQSLLDERAIEVARLADKGKRLQDSVTDPAINSEQMCQRWIAAVNVWTDESHKAINRHSKRAAEAFMAVGQPDMLDLVVSGSGKQFHLGVGDVRNCYQGLSFRLGTLARIVERPSLFF